MDTSPAFDWQPAASRRSPLPMLLFMAALLLSIVAMIAMLPRREPGAPSWPIGRSAEQHPLSADANAASRGEAAVTRAPTPDVAPASAPPQKVKAPEASKTEAPVADQHTVVRASRPVRIAAPDAAPATIPDAPARKPDLFAVEARTAARAYAAARAEPEPDWREPELSDYGALRRRWLAGDP